MPLYQSSRDLLFNLEATTTTEARKKWKQSIKDHWKHQCAYCGSDKNLTLDHIIPRTKGGSDRLTNIICACKSCNYDKGHQKWYDWYLNQSFFSTERLTSIIEWQNQITEQQLEVYKPRKVN